MLPSLLRETLDKSHTTDLTLPSSPGSSNKSHQRNEEANGSLNVNNNSTNMRNNSNEEKNNNIEITSSPSMEKSTIPTSWIDEKIRIRVSEGKISRIRSLSMTDSIPKSKRSLTQPSLFLMDNNSSSNSSNNSSKASSPHSMSGTTGSFLRSSNERNSATPLTITTTQEGTLNSASRDEASSSLNSFSTINSLSLSDNPSISFSSDSTSSPSRSITLTPLSRNDLKHHYNNSEQQHFEVEDLIDQELEKLPFHKFFKLCMLGENVDGELKRLYVGIADKTLLFATDWFKYLALFFVILFFVLLLTSDDYEQYSILPFMFLFPFEGINNLFLNYLTCCKCKSPQMKSLVHMLRTLILVVVGTMIQTYYSTLPLYIGTVMKIIIMSTAFGEEVLISSISGTLLGSSALFSLYLNGATTSKLIEIGCLMLCVLSLCLFLCNTYTKEKQEKYKQKMAFLQEKYLSNEKTHLIANISHEARNPLHGIIGCSTILRHELEKTCAADRLKRNSNSSSSDEYVDSGNEPNLELINDIYNNANLLLHIFSTSLQLTSLEMGNVKLKYEPFNIQTMVESVISVFYNIAADKKVSLHSYIELGKLPGMVIGDHVRISQVLMNFISNSIKYSSPDVIESSVILKCYISTEEDLSKNGIDKEEMLELLEDRENIVFLRIDCIDNGKGIESQNINNLFKPFQTFDLKSNETNMESSGTLFDQYYLKSMSGRKGNASGSSLLLSNRTGVGLNISKQLVERMNGSIVVSSQLGKGTTMSVIFPLKVSSSENSVSIENTLKQKISHLGDIQSSSVIIIDREVRFLEILGGYIQQFAPGTNVEKYTDVISVPRVSREGSLIVIYSDMYHSEVKEAFRAIKEKLMIPIGIRGRTRKYPKMKYIIKPIKADDLISALLDNLQRHRRQSIKVSSKPLHEQPHDDEATTSVKKILITDDNEINRKVMERMIRMLGYTGVECATNGAECFELFKQKNYSVILMDLLMPVMCGKESVKSIRQYEKVNNKKRTPVISLTANVWETADMLKEAGFDSVIYKPILIEKLREELDNALKLSE